MSIASLGLKVGMTQIINVKRGRIPITIIKIYPSYITAFTENKISGYKGIQIGSVEVESNKKISKPEIGHLKQKNLPILKYLKEFSYTKSNEVFLGKILDLNIFEIGEKITIKGKTIGKGNAGNIKKNHFQRGPMSHGSKHHRLQGSLGAGTTPSRVFPGKKMPGRLGGSQTTIKNIEIIAKDFKNNLLVVKGSVPGKFGTLLSLIKS